MITGRHRSSTEPGTSSARPPPAPLGRAQPRRRLLPPARPPCPHRHPPPRRHRTRPPTPILTTATRWGTSVSNSGQDHLAPSLLPNRADGGPLRVVVRGGTAQSS